MTEKYAINPIPILVYHQIDKPPSKGTRLRGLVVDPRSFSWQMSMLKILGFSGHSMNGLEPYLSGKSRVVLLALLLMMVIKISMIWHYPY